MSTEELNDQADFADDELIIRKKKQPEQKTGVTAAGVLKTAAEALEALRAKGPLVQCMTNAVAADSTARALKALGAAYAMVEDMGEASQFTSVMDGLLVNVGTATKPQTDAMRAAVSHANMGGKPWVLDPVGVGALPLRTFTVKELMRRFPALIRGNADEINFLVHNTLPARGTTLTSDAVAQDAARLAGVTHAAVLLTGATDYVALEGAPLVAVRVLDQPPRGKVDENERDQHEKSARTRADPIEEQAPQCEHSVAEAGRDNIVYRQKGGQKIKEKR